MQKTKFLPAMKNNKKGAIFGNLYNTVLGFLVLAILIAVTLVVLVTMGTNSSIEGTAAETSINETIDAVDDIPGWFGIMVVVIIAGALIFLVTRGIGGGGKL